MDIGFLSKDFENFKSLGQGAYGVVIKAQNKKNKKFYAVKLCQNEDKKKENGYYDIPYTSLREVTVLKALRHPFIVKLSSPW